MPRLDFKTRETVQGKAAEFISRIPEQLGLPLPFSMIAVSPGLMEAQMHVIGYFMNHRRFEPSFVACLRLCSAHRLGFQSCLDFNRKLLIMQGVTPEEIDATLADPFQAPFDEAHRALLDLALRAALEPETVTDADVDQVRRLGFQDSDIYDASIQAAQLIAPGRLAVAFDA